jgi:hypothetical protein
MSRRARRTSPGLGSLAAFLSATAILPLAATVHARTDPPVSAFLPQTDRFPLCSNVLQAHPAGRLLAPITPTAGLSAAAGLWVGAEVDRGGGLEQIVSTTVYEIEFFPLDPTVLPNVFGESRQIYADTSTVVAPHEPLALRVTQIASPAQRPGYGGFIRLHFDVRNISHVFQPPGWDMTHVYLGMFADADVGLGSVGNPWSDDLGAYASTPDGGLAYVWDAPGHGDDTSERMGVLLPGREAHSFQVWASPADELTDLGKYALLRGDGYNVQTIDPPSTRPDDQRILVSVGPFTIAPGASQSFDVALVCGDPLPPRPFEEARRGSPAAPRVAIVSPNPVSRTSPGVRFANVARGARVSVYETSGRLVRTFTAGASGEVSWNLAARGAPVPAGVYLVRVVDAEGSKTGKLVVVR